MKELLRRKIQLCYYVQKAYILGFLRAIIGKITWNSYFTIIEKQKLTNRLRLFKTIYFNFRTMPAGLAWKTPVWVYGKIKFYDLSGSALPINKQDVVPGIFVIGNMDQVRSCDTITSITLSGTIYYGKNVVLRQGAKLRISGELFFENNVYVGDNNTFIIEQFCKLGEKSRIANNCTFMDTDIHYMINVNSGDVSKNVKPIVIGIGNWIGAYTMTKKGVKTPDFMITAGPYACLTKDYTRDIPLYACVGGCPAKLIKVGLRRINNPQNEHMLAEYFENNSGMYHFDGDIDKFCSPN